MQTTRLQQMFFFVLLAGIFVLAFMVFQPYLVVLAVSAMAAVALHPFHDRLTKLLRGRSSLAALLTVLTLVVLLLIPVSLMGSQILREAAELYQEVRQNRDVYLHTIEDAILAPVRIWFPTLDLSLDVGIERALGWLTQNFGAIFSGTAGVLLDLILGIVALFYFLRDGKRFAESFMRLSPLQDRHDRVIMDRLVLAVNSVIRGQLLIAIIQGSLTGIGFWIFGVPNPALWGSVAAVCALVPGVGTSLVLIPGIIMLLVTGQTWPALGLAIWGSLAVGLIDNMLGPYLVGRGANVHPLWILFGVLGGISVFGPMGFLLGPLLVSLLFALLDIYRMVILKMEE
jgi:predicted PurR-regulated permease PerM